MIMEEKDNEYICEDCNTSFDNKSDAIKCENYPHDDVISPQGKIYMRLQKINGGSLTQVMKFVCGNSAEERMFMRMRENLIDKSILEENGKVEVARGRGYSTSPYYSVNKKLLDNFLYGNIREHSNFLLEAALDKWSHPKVMFRIRSFLKKNPNYFTE